MQAGYVISGIAHAGLIGWALFGGMFTPQDQEIVFENVSVVSEAQFQAMIASDQIPDVPQFDLKALDPTEETDLLPEVEEPSDKVVDQTEPPQHDPVTEEITPPEPVEPLVVPIPDITTPDVQPPAPQVDTAMMLPDVSTGSAPIQANRVAPKPVAPPEQPSIIDDVTQEATVPADAVEAIVEDVPKVEETTAPEAASSEIITEAKKDNAARQSSPRPVLRPSNFKPTSATETVEANLEDILREVTQSETLEASELKAVQKSGPPLTGGEKNAFRKQVGNCWSVNVGSRAANVTVKIAMQMQPDGKVVASSLEMIGFEGGNQSDANVAFEAGRRAILRCQKDGYDLPKDKYDQWRNVEIKFNPSEMRKR